ncbi:unnamed protein product [Rangifer tarandus platyrhynchus]|uniref:Uncharacterized protein n=2 Tax=Rangifer tarandus platyrhynchus TaxID=3082113 RepID=A0AC59YAI9_RANTA|nr:unnamed protein product [Rangifer tarandus platyrhynchus]
MDNPSLLQRWLGENFNSQTHPVLKPRTPLSFLAPESMRLNPVARRGHPLRRPPQSQSVHGVHVQLQLSGALTPEDQEGAVVEGKAADPGQLKMPHGLTGSHWLPTAGPGGG